MCHTETDAELFNHAEVADVTHGLHTNLGDLPLFVHELVFYHTNATIVDRDGRVGLVRNGLNEEIWLALDIFRIGTNLLIVRIERRVPPFCGNGSQSPIRRIRGWDVAIPHAETREAPPHGASRSSSLTYVHCCPQVSLAPICANC